MQRRFGSRFALVVIVALGATAQAACAQMQPAGAAGTTAGTASPAGDAASTHWYDGERRRVLRVDPEWVADFRGAKPELERTPEQAAKAATGKSGPALSAGQSQVLRDETGAPLALPGGVIVRLRDADLAGATRLFTELGLRPLRALDPEERTWLVESPPGLESLALANRLHESGRFESAAPNWWRPRSLK